MRRFAGPGAGRVYQVWLQGRPGAPPRPTPKLVTVGLDGSAAVPLPPGARRASRVLVSSEPAGGSRTGVPSRPPVIVAAL